ncbi:MAG: hypothetical protein ACI311_03200 [Bacilli bacterium]
MVEKEDKRVYTSKSYVCENCGSSFVYDADNGVMRCPHCDTTLPLEETQIAKETPFTNDVISKSCVWKGTKCVQCEDCGAEFVLSNNETSTSCPFCGRVHILERGEIPGIRPSGIIPFEIGYKEAKNIFLRWVKSKSMAPKSFKKTARERKIDGVYIPTFTFDSRTVSSYKLTYGTYHTRTVGTGKNRHTETYMTTHTGSGTISMNFNDINIEASCHIEQNKYDALGGYNTHNASSFHDQFISGYSCERYSESISDSWNEAISIMKERIKRGVINRYTGVDTVISYSANTSYNDNSYKYILVPVYFINYIYKNKNYQCRIHGVSGKAKGEAPVSVGKVLAIVFTVLLIVGIIIVLLVMNDVININEIF